MTGNRIIVRHTEPSDAAALEAIYRRAVESGPGRLLDVETMDGWLADRDPGEHVAGLGEAGRGHLVAECRGLRAGFAVWRGDWLTSLYVDPDRQGMGVGRALLAACRAEASGGIRGMESTLSAVGFYERAGYRCAGAAYQERRGVRIPHMRMIAAGVW